MYAFEEVLALLVDLVYKRQDPLSIIAHFVSTFSNKGPRHQRLELLFICVQLNRVVMLNTVTVLEAEK